MQTHVSQPLFHSLLLACCLVLTGAVVQADEPVAEEPRGGLFSQGRNVDMPALIAPIVREGRLRGYAYVTLQLVVRERDLWRVREHIPFIQDAFVREVYGPGILVSDENDDIDPLSLEGRLLERARAVMGRDIVLAIRMQGVARRPY
jgi:hypothetical protein